jgi:hypothetical protein
MKLLQHYVFNEDMEITFLAIHDIFKEYILSDNEHISSGGLIFSEICKYIEPQFKQINIQYNLQIYENLIKEYITTRYNNAIQKLILPKYSEYLHVMIKENRLMIMFKDIFSYSFIINPDYNILTMISSPLKDIIELAKKILIAYKIEFKPM